MKSHYALVPCAADDAPREGCLLNAVRCLLSLCRDETETPATPRSSSSLNRSGRWLLSPGAIEETPTPRTSINRIGTVLQLADMPMVRGHRFSRTFSQDEMPGEQPAPTSPLARPVEEAKHERFVPPDDAPHALLLDPGSGEACGALQLSMHVHLAIGPAYDEQVKRYPPHWKSMVGVRLSEAEAAADAAAEAGAPKSSWPGVHDLRGPAHPRNLATWAGAIYDAEARSVRAVDLSAHGGVGRRAAHQLEPAAVPTSRLCCLVCGSRGGQVTLPALWRLGCTLPSVVVNGGCARTAAGWVWPPGVPVVLLTGGRDALCNEFAKWAEADGRRAFLEQTWAAVPPASRPTTAIVHLPDMGHRPEARLLRALLPPLVAWAASGLAAERKPTAAALCAGGLEVDAARPPTLVTAQHPLGEQLAPLQLPPAASAASPPEAQARAAGETC